MTWHELFTALERADPASEVVVVLFTNDGTSQGFEREEVLSLDGRAPLEIDEAEEAERHPCSSGRNAR